MEECKWKEMFLCSGDQLDLEKTFYCGQCFRWRSNTDGSYTGVAWGHAARIKEKEGGIYLTSSPASMTLWQHYFHLELDYQEISFDGVTSEYFKRCAAYGAGIRILQQEPWETLCTFIISQCNNIPRITGIVDALCRELGEQLVFDGEALYTFPSPAALLDAGLPKMQEIGCGYRGKYLISAARKVVEEGFDLEALKSVTREAAEKALLSLHGVGTKVANCILLFGLSHMSGFPVDVWMKRALEQHFPPDFDPCVFGEFAGLAQQYIFFYARMQGNCEK